VSSAELDRASLRHVRQLENIQASRLLRTSVPDPILVSRGLSGDDVRQRIELGLTNRVNDSSSRSLLSILRANLLTLFNAVVGGSFLLLLALGQWKDALFGFAVVANVLIGIIQEFNSKRTLDRIAIMNQPRVTVLRDSNQVEIAVADVVLDDTLILNTGDQISADALILQSTELEVDESLLTGEADSVDKGTGDAVLSGSFVVGGNALAKTVKIGIESYSNVITREAKRFSLVKSELRTALARIVRWISWALIPLMIISVNGQMQAVGGWNHAFASGEWVAAVVASIASIISMIPQGLVLITSISFALAAVALARKQVLVQELPAVEGLARVDVVCFDKTGTLTHGDISFSECEVLAQRPELSDFRRVLGTMANARDANATTRALIPEFSSDSSGVALRSIPFSSVRKWSAISLDDESWWVLGAPEILLANLPTTDVAIAERISVHSALGARTLLLARTAEHIDAAEPQLHQAPEPVCLLTFAETVRHDASDTIAYFIDQGIALKVISGDNPLTVSAVATKAGIPQATSAIDARTLASVDDETFDAAVLNNTVFGRVTPEQKKRMVLALQTQGHVVAMTGDGVNDALALKAADMGIAMGNGSAATKAVSRIVLLDSAFDMLPKVLGEGRRVIANVERVSRLFLTKTTWAMLLALVFGFLLWTFPFLPRQLSGVDGYTIGIASFFLALLPNKRRYLPGFLRRSLMFCIPSGLVIGATVVAFSVWGRTSEHSPNMLQTSVAIILSITGLWVLVTLSRPYDKWRLLITLAMYAMFVGMFTIPLIRDFFGFTTLPLPLTAVTLLFAAIACMLIEIVTRVVDRLLSRHNADSAGQAHPA